MTSRKPPIESYAEREARYLAAYRLGVIADPKSHPDHADDAQRLLTMPRVEDVMPYVETLDAVRLGALAVVLRGHPITCSCPRLRATEPSAEAVEPDTSSKLDPDPDLLPARVETKPASTAPTSNLVTTREWVDGVEVDVPEPTDPEAAKLWREARLRRGFGD